MRLSRLVANRNWWLSLETPMIPLGTMTLRGVPVQRENGKRQPVMMPLPKQGDRFGVLRQVSTIVLVVAVPGAGKSVSAKGVEFFLSQDRPVIDFDWAGEDSFRCFLPNSWPVNLPPYTAPGGIRGVYFYYPVKNARPRASWERIVRPCITKYDVEQLEAIGFATSAAMYFKNILRRYGPFRSWEDLYDFVENFPVNDVTNRRLRKKIEQGKVRLKHTRVYEEGDTINGQSKESIKKILPGIIEKGVFSLDDKEEVDFDKLFLQGRNMIFSFNDQDVARVEINHYMQRIVAMRKSHRESPRYFVKIEEAHKVFAKEGKKLDEVIEDFVLVCRKHSVGILLVLPEASKATISDRVLMVVKHIIAGELSGESASRIAGRIGKDQEYFRVLNTLHGLRNNPIKGEREFLYFNGLEKAWWTFEPFNSPCEIHREA